MDQHSTMTLNHNLYELLSELVLCCDETGRIIYANPAAQHWSATPLVHQPFHALLTPDTEHKGDLFLAAARNASFQHPTPPWELALGTVTEYTIGHFRGYREADHLVIIGQVEPADLSAMQRELMLLTSDLTETQRELHRQNRALQQALNEQRRLVETIQALTAPAAPIWKGVLLLPIVGHLDSSRTAKIARKLLEQVSQQHTRYTILDVSGIALIDTGVAKHLLDTIQALRLLGAQAILVGIRPEIAQTMVQLGLHLQEFVIIQSNLQHAVAYVLRHMQKEVLR